MKTYRYLSFITAFYITFLLVSDISAGKLTVLLGFVVPVAVFYFPFTFILGDVLTEVYGYAQARRVAWVAFFSTLLAAVIYQVVVVLPPAPGFIANDAYTRVLGVLPRIALSSVASVWIGTMLNDYVMAKMKVWSNGKYLWMRAVTSTVVGQGVATAFFFVVGLGGIIPATALLSSVLSGWLFKVTVEILLLPLTYRVTTWLKQVEEVDYYDHDTVFNPFIMNTNNGKR